MLCQEIMKTDVECVDGRAPAREAARKMRKASVGFLPVCNADREVMGAITDRDITIRLVANGCPLDTPVADIMTDNVVACRSTASIRRAEKLMSLHKLSRLMCVDEVGHLVGVISLSDIAQIEDARHAADTLRNVSSRESEGTNAT